MSKPIMSAQELLEFEVGMKNMWGMLPTVIEEYSFRARIKKEKFKALKEEGFTDEQALQIIVSGGSDIQL